MFKRVRFLSDQTLIVSSQEETAPVPDSPQINPLELSELSDLEDLEIPPSEFFEENKQEITSFFTGTAADTKPSLGTRHTFEPLDGLKALDKSSLKRQRSRSFSVKAHKKSILDFLTVNKLAS